MVRAYSSPSHFEWWLFCLPGSGGCFLWVIDLDLLIPTRRKFPSIFKSFWPVPEALQLIYCTTSSLSTCSAIDFKKGHLVGRLTTCVLWLEWISGHPSMSMLNRFVFVLFSRILLMGFSNYIRWRPDHSNITSTDHERLHRLSGLLPLYLRTVNCTNLLRTLAIA